VFKPLKLKCAYLSCHKVVDSSLEVDKHMGIRADADTIYILLLDIVVTNNRPLSS
jgi:hypothetical protein